MTKKYLREIFEHKYDSAEWRQLLTQLFPKREFFSQPIEEKDSDLRKHDNVESIKRFGDFRLDDSSRLVFYEVELKEGRNVTSRVELRNLLHNEVIPGDVDAILAVYFNRNARDWRVSMISKSLYWDDEMNEIKQETHPKRYTYVLGETEKVTTPINQFHWLFSNVIDEVKLPQIIKAFSVEKISNEFFKEYFHQFKTFESYIIETPFFEHFESIAVGSTPTEKREDAEKLVRTFVKKMLGRIVFIYFLQKKGWMDVDPDKEWGEGNKDFISDLFNNEQNKTQFYTNKLIPLFLDTLNRNRDNDIFEATGKKVPFLNGGLFDKDLIEPLDINFKVELWERLFEFFNQYNFTIDENIPDDQDIGIDPE
ncbi:MAG: hypothetical protein KDE33_27205, partial [Bacteroidetes bacterium]|nr:hypothetical protein [Bacteroidota bacterium]